MYTHTYVNSIFFHSYITLLSPLRGEYKVHKDEKHGWPHVTQCAKGETRISALSPGFESLPALPEGPNVSPEFIPSPDW